MEHVLLVVHVIIAAALIGMVLLQRSDTDGFGLGSGGGSGLLSGRAQANLMTRTTAILAALFIANSLLLSILASQHRAPSIVDTIEQQQMKKDLAPAVPTAGADKAKATEKTAAPEVKQDTAPAALDATENGTKKPQAVEQSIAPKPVKAKKPAAPKAPADSDDSDQ